MKETARKCFGGAGVHQGLNPCPDTSGRLRWVFQEPVNPCSDTVICRKRHVLAFKRSIRRLRCGGRAGLAGGGSSL
jgi:hypothetical protein